MNTFTVGEGLTRILIAGGPGTGKSTLLSALHSVGEICFEEVSRKLIRNQLAINGDLVPWKNLAAFAQRCSEQMESQLAQSARYRRAFFDRGPPDVIGYLRHGGLAVSPDLFRASQAYTPVVYFAPPWPEIYVNDRERPQTYLESVALSSQIRSAYLECGFEIIDLVKSSVAERVKQVLEHVKSIEGGERISSCEVQPA